jgi:hypothetical protein
MFSAKMPSAPPTTGLAGQMTADTRVKTIGEITTSHLFDMVVDLSPRIDSGGGLI